MRRAKGSISGVSAMAALWLILAPASGALPCSAYVGFYVGFRSRPVKISLARPALPGAPQARDGVLPGAARGRILRRARAEGVGNGRRSRSAEGKVGGTGAARDDADAGSTRSAADSSSTAWRVRGAT